MIGQSGILYNIFYYFGAKIVGSLKSVWMIPKEPDAAVQSEERISNNAYCIVFIVLFFHF